MPFSLPVWDPLLVYGSDKELVASGSTGVESDISNEGQWERGIILFCSLPLAPPVTPGAYHLMATTQRLYRRGEDGAVQ